MQIYRNNDKPLYRTGNKVLIGICVYNMALFIGAKIFYVLKNRYVIYIQTLSLPALFVELVTNAFQLAPAKVGCDDGL